MTDPQGTDPQPISEETGPLQVLLVEDNPGDARLFEEYLREGPVEATCRHEPTLEAGLEALDEGAPDVLALDLGLPNSEGAETVEAAVGAAPKLPIVVLTGQGDLGVALQAQEAGAAEYLQKKDLSPPLLARTLRWAAQRARMQAKLRQRDAWVRSITEGLSAGVFRAGPTGQILYANEALAKMLGFGSGEELVGQDLTEFYADPSSRGRILAEEGAAEVEIEFEGQDGLTFIGLLSAEVAYDADGIPVHYDGTITDITGRKEKEERLRVLSEAVEQAKESVIITEAEPLEKPGPRIEYVNEAYEEMTGYSQEEILGETPRILQGPETERAVLDSLREALEAGEEWQGESVNYRKDGEPYRVQWNVAPVRGENGKIEHWVSVQRDVTEEREREEALRHQKSLLEQTQRLAGAWEVDLEADEVAWSRAMYRIYELPPGTEVTLEKAFSFYPSEGQEKLQSAFERCARSGEPYDVEVPLVTAEGTRRWVRAVGAPAEKEDGEIMKVAGALQDITEREESRRELERQKKYTDRLLDAIDDLFFVLDEGGQLRRWNDSIPEVTGYSGEEIGGMTAFDLVPEEKREQVAEQIKEGFTEGHAQIEVPLLRKDGTEVSYEFMGNLVEHPERGLRAVGIGRDITERKKHKRHLARTVERVTDAIVEVGPEWRFTLVNEQAEALYDMAAEDLLGEGFWDVFEEALGTRFEEEYRGVMQTREPTRFEAYYPGLEGWFEIQGHPNENGGLSFYFENITERKRREKRLKEAKEEAERMNRLKSAFLANMSHEIRTPLTSILGFAEAIEEEAVSLDPPAQAAELGSLGEFAGLIQRSGRRLMETLTGVLNLSRLEAGEMTLSVEPIDLAKEAEETAEEFRPQAEEAGIELTSDLESPAWAEVDEGGLHIILRNLFSNAIKYTEAGGEVWVRARAEEDLAILEVEDTGIGMDPETTAELFEAFKQESEGVGREYEGTGLGLTLVREVLDRMDGSIEVETEKGEGSRFTVRLPRSEQSGEA